MKKLVLFIFLSACSLTLPAKLPSDLKTPVSIEKNGKILTVYVEGQGSTYSILGIHPLSGREFLIQVKAGKLTKEEYGYLFSAREVKEILDEMLKNNNQTLIID